MQWSVGWSGAGEPGRAPVDGQAIPGLPATWTCGWRPARRAAAADGDAAIAVVGVCGASAAQLRTSLPAVRAGRWRKLTCWPGSYLVVARHGERLAVLGDLAGLHPLYWRTHNGGTWWSTAAWPLAALDGGRPVPDPVVLAAELAFGQPDVLGARSRFPGVHRVPPGAVLLIGPEGPQVQRYEPLDYPPRNLPDAADLVRASLHTAVAVRCDSREQVSADLAGLDSTTLACLAAVCGPVTAVTFADARLRDDDLHYARRTAAAVPALDHQVVPGSADTVYYAGLDDLADLPVTDAPHLYVATARIKSAVLDAARGPLPGPGVHFTGAAGDGVLSASADYLADLVRDRRFPTFWRHATGHARLRRTSPRTVIAAAGPAATMTLPGTWRTLAATLRAAARPWSPAEFAPIAWTSMSAGAAWMRPELRAGLADALIEAADRLPAADTPRRLAAYIDRQDLVRVATNTAGWAALAWDRHGVELASPYLDNEVIRACLAVPGEQRGAPDVFKPLLARAFAGAGVVPDFVLARTTKGGFDGVAYAGLVAHAATITELLGTSSRLAAAGLIDPDQVADLLGRARAGLRVPQGALHAGVAAEVWLRQMDTVSTWWQEVPAHAAVA